MDDTWSKGRALGRNFRSLRVGRGWQGEGRNWSRREWYQYSHASPFYPPCQAKQPTDLRRFSCSWTSEISSLHLLLEKPHCRLWGFLLRKEMESTTPLRRTLVAIHCHCWGQEGVAPDFKTGTVPMQSFMEFPVINQFGCLSHSHC